MRSLGDHDVLNRFILLYDCLFERVIGNSLINGSLADVSCRMSLRDCLPCVFLRCGDEDVSSLAHDRIFSNVWDDFVFFGSAWLSEWWMSSVF